MRREGGVWKVYALMNTFTQERGHHANRTPRKIVKYSLYLCELNPLVNTFKSDVLPIQ